MKDQKIAVSVIMRSKNSDWVITQALGALYSQTFKDFELIVVDSGSTDRTLEIINQFPCQLIRIDAKSYYPGSVLNMAIEKAQGEIIVFQNSDGVPLSPHTLQLLIDVFKDNEVEAALARQIPRPDAFSWVRRDYELSFPDKDKTPEWIRLSLPLAAIRKRAWEKHHFYTDAWASEDTEWGEWAIRDGYRIKYVKDAIIMHSHNYNLKQLYGRKFVEGEADTFIYNKKPSLSGMMSAIFRQTLRDIFFLGLQGKLTDVITSLPRNYTSNRAYYKGLKLGYSRRKTGNQDISIGQRNVLTRYEK